MAEPRNYHDKWSRLDRERQVSYESTNMWNLKKNDKKNLFTKQKQTPRLKNQTYGYQMGNTGGEG